MRVESLLVAGMFAALLAAIAPDVPAQGGPKLIAQADVNIRSAPPNGLFCRRGERLGVLPKGTAIEDYREVSAVCGLFFSFPYLRVTHTAADGKTTTGFVSLKNDDGSDLFKPEN